MNDDENFVVVFIQLLFTHFQKRLFSNTLMLILKPSSSNRFRRHFPAKSEREKIVLQQIRDMHFKNDFILINFIIILLDSCSIYNVFHGTLYTWALRFKWSNNIGSMCVCVGYVIWATTFPVRLDWCFLTLFHTGLSLILYLVNLSKFNYSNRSIHLQN